MWEHGTEGREKRLALWVLTRRPLRELRSRWQYDIRKRALSEKFSSDAEEGGVTKGKSN